MTQTTAEPDYTISVADNVGFAPSLPFLVHRLTARLVGEASKEFLEMGFSVQGARAMIVLLRNPGIRVGALADITCIENSTLSHMLKRMSDEGLILRERQADDDRTVVVHLTNRGKRMARDCQKASVEHERLLLDGMSDEETASLRKLLSKMHHNVEKAVKERGAGRAPQSVSGPGRKKRKPTV